MGTKKCPHKYKDFGYCHLCGDILFPFVGFTRPYTHRIDTPPPTAFPMFPSHTRERFAVFIIRFACQAVSLKKC